MPTREELISALNRAASAGDYQAANEIAEFLDRQDAQSAFESQQSPQPISRDELLRMQSTVQYPSADTTLGALGEGFVRGVEEVGEGLLQRAMDAYEFIGFDPSGLRKDLAISRDIQQQKFAPTEKEFPVASTVGEIGGSVAALPIGAATIPKAVAAGGAFGAAQYLEEGEGLGDFAKNIAVDALAGGLGQAAAPYIQKGFNKGQALFSGIYKKATGIDPRPEMFTPSGTLSGEGKKALSDLGMSEDEFSRIYQNLDNNLNPIQAARQERAKELGVDLTQGQVTKDFAQQEAEQTLRSGLGREAEAARQIENLQQKQLREAAESFTTGLGDVSEGKMVAGGNIQKALRELEEEGRKNVSQLYENASNIPGNKAPLDSESLLDTIDESVIARPVDPRVSNSIESLMAKYGLIDGEIEKAGRFNQIIQADGTKVKFKGDQESLNLDNAEKFRQGLNQLMPNDDSGAVKQIIGKLDELVGQTIQELPGSSQKAVAFKEARAAAREQFKNFSDKDIIDNLVSYKKGTSTDLVDPGVVMDRIYKGKDGFTNLQKVKTALMQKPSNKTVDAWKSVQAQGVSDIFGQSINPATGEISGQRLSSAIKRFGNGSTEEGKKKLKLLLGDKYNQFNNLTQVIGDATIPLKGATNTSGTAYKLLNFLTRVGTVGQFGADAVATVATKAKDAAKSKSILKNIEKASPEKVTQAIKANDELIDAVLGLAISRTLQTE